MKVLSHPILSTLSAVEIEGYGKCFIVDSIDDGFTLKIVYQPRLEREPGIHLPCAPRPKEQFYLVL
jgi:hypothetical protein